MQDSKVKNSFTAFLLFTVLLFAACAKMNSENRSENLTIPEYITWVENEENGLKVKKEIAEFTFTLQYKPLDYIALMDARNPLISLQKIDSIKTGISDMQYYTFSIKASDFNDELLKYKIKNMDEYYYRIEHFAFNMQKNISLISGTDTLPCNLYHFERNFGISPEAKFVLGFPLTKSNNDLLFIYNEEIFGTGTVKLIIRKEDINNIPNLLIQ